MEQICSSPRFSFWKLWAWKSLPSPYTKHENVIDKPVKHFLQVVKNSLWIMPISEEILHFEISNITW